MHCQSPDLGISTALIIRLEVIWVRRVAVSLVTVGLEGGAMSIHAH